METPFSPEEHRANTIRQQEDIQSMADFIATLLDSAFLIPGTSLRIGLDPLLGLIPGFGDFLANLIGSSLLFLAAQLGVPKIVLFRMALNIFLNMVIGSVPGIGDLFSCWFKSNIRNATLLRRYCRAAPPSTTFADWSYVLLILIVMVAGMILILLGTVWLLVQVVQFIQ